MCSCVEDSRGEMRTSGIVTNDERGFCFLGLSGESRTFKEIAMASEVIGTVENPEHRSITINIPAVVLIVGSGAVGGYVGWRIGGATGAAVGALVGSFVGALAAGYIRRLRVTLHSDGRVEVEFETRF